MERPFNRAMLQVARAARGFTQGDLAKRSGVTQAAISKLEHGLTHEPTREVVGAIANALGYPESLLYCDEKPHGLPQFHYRKRARLGAKALHMIESEINLRRIHIARMLQSYEVEAEYSLPAIDLDREQIDPRGAAQRLRAFWMVPRGPIESLTELVERAGVIVVQMDFGTNLLDALSFRLPGMRPLIFINKNVPGDRYRFTLAHELGHLIIHNHPEDDDIMERQADDFAAELLMPRAEIRPYLSRPSLGKLARVKAHWKVSIKALIVQTARMKLITEGQYKGLNVNYSKAGYTRGEPYPIDIEPAFAQKKMIQFHLSDLGFSPDEVADLLMLTTDEFTETYQTNERPRLRVVK